MRGMPSSVPSSCLSSQYGPTISTVTSISARISKSVCWRWDREEECKMIGGEESKSATVKVGDKSRSICADSMREV